VIAKRSIGRRSAGARTGTERGSVTGEGASWNVAVHLITRDPELLAPFVALGFRPGLDPQRPTLGGLHDLTALLLKAFDARPGMQALQGSGTVLARRPDALFCGSMARNRAEGGEPTPSRDRTANVTVAKFCQTG